MRIFEFEKNKDNVAFIDEFGRKVYYEEVMEFAKKITSKISTNKHIYMKASINLVFAFG